MIKEKVSVRKLFLFVILLCSINAVGKNNESTFVDASDFGFLPHKSGIENSIALQKAVDETGTIVVKIPGIYKIARTIYIGSNTNLIFGNNISLKKVNEEGEFSHVIANKGAKTKSFDKNIIIEGLQIIVNDIDVRDWSVAHGLHGQLSFFYVKDLRIERFRCKDLGKWQYGIHVCTFEDLIIDDVIIKGDKDGIHLGRGKRFSISNGVFQTFDDAIALNGHDYSTGNPELGWIESGVIENCHDLNQDNTTGFFCRILAGAWTDWKKGMEVQQSDAVVSNGKIYRVQMEPDGKVYRSQTRPTHAKGSKVIDGITWGVVQDEVSYTAGVRNVSFNNIFLEKPRIAFSIHFDNDKYSRSYYPGANVPNQENITFDNIRILHDEENAFLAINTPIDVITVSNCSFQNNPILFKSNNAMEDYGVTRINLYGCVFHHPGEMNLIVNNVENKELHLNSNLNIEMYNDFVANIIGKIDNIKVFSDSDNLRKQY